MVHAKLLMSLQTDNLSTETSDFLKQINFLKSFHSVFTVSSIQSSTTWINNNNFI